MKKILLICATTVASIFQTSAQCLMYPVLLSERIPQSSLVIEGKVINHQSFWNNTHDKIYTSNLIEVYKSFKNTVSPYIEIITEGGIVGNAKHVFEPTLELTVGDIGVFTLNQNNQPSQFGKQVYNAYANAQGFIKYDVAGNIASEPFNKYQNASSTLYPTIAQYTGANYIQIKSINPFQQSASSINSIQNIAAITGFSPTTITAGTFSVLTISGSGFGTISTPSLVAFKNADDGGATTISPVADEIISWSDIQIQVKVPTKAGTGVIKVNGVNSTSTLTIPYSQLSVNSTGIIYNTKHINQSGGGYTWTYNTAFNTNAPAKAAFQRSLQSWRCATYINWPTAATTSTITSSVNDGVNIVTFNSSLAAGILGQCGSYFSGCGTNPTQTWFVSELDIQFANTPGGLTWQYGTAAPSGTQYDFESVTVHELGHGHQLGHVIKSTDLMHYALSNGQSKRTLNTDDLNGGLAVMVRNAQAGGTCALPLMTPLTSGNCALGAPTANFSANRTTVCPGQTVIFTDLSTGTPTVLAWTFAGGTASTSSVSSPTITYNTPGTYSVQLIATNVNGTSTYSMATYINVVNPSALPLVQDFQSATYPPTNWYINDAGSDNIIWKLAPTTGYNSTQSTIFNNFNDSINNRDELKTYVNLSGYSTAKMTFYRSYSQTFTTPYIDTLQIGISINCGTSSVYPYLKGGSQLATATTATSSAVFTPTAASQWIKDSIDLTPYIGQGNVMVAFINRGHYGDAIYLDNINITGIAATTPTAAISSVSVGCTGIPITLTDASTGGPSSWTWIMTGGTPASANTQNTSVTYTTAGVKTITLTVANVSGTTTATKSITITASPTIAASMSSTTICSGGSITETLTGATTYTWLPSGSGSISTLTPASTTIYTITGSTGACNSNPITVTINVTSTPTIGTSITNTTICSGTSVLANLTGASNYTWLPTGSGTASTLSPSSTTIYSVTGSNGNCNSASKTFTINVSATPSVVATTTNVTCNGICNGIINTTATGGSGFTYIWSPGGVATSSMTNVCAGNYTLLTTNTSGCSKTITAQITQPSSLGVNVTKTNVTCFGMCNGTSTISAIGGSAPYTYSLVLGTPVCQTTICSGLCAGAYTVLVKDANNCSATSSLIISQPTQLVASVSNTNASCSGCADGSAVSTVSGGTAGYTYLWSNGNTTSNPGNLTPGCYTATVTDMNGCVDTKSTCISFGTRVDELTFANNISVYPNPGNGIFTVSSTTNSDKLEIIVTNALGQTVISESVKNTAQLHIDLSKMSKGVYYLKATTNEGNKLVKLILE